MELFNNLIDSTILNPTIQIWVSVLFTLMILSFLYRDNPLYKFGENTFLGISLGYGWTKLWYVTVVPYLIRPIKDAAIDFNAYDLVMVFWLAMGSTLFFRFTRTKAWVANYYFAFVFAYFAGYQIPINVQSLFIQADNMMHPIFEQPSFFEVTKWIVIIFGTFAGLLYFFFSKPHKGLFGKTARIGIIILMINFGASFGATVMGRIALFIGRAQVLAENWQASIVFMIAIIIFLFIYFKFVYKEPAFDDEQMH
ncbi:MAG: hypothetical protein JXR69_01490 [Candidatus Delongbacteria bacterium]|nr:hypothetical protein [Candidatus Delongbacteria bacterium]